MRPERLMAVKDTVTARVQWPKGSQRSYSEISKYQYQVSENERENSIFWPFWHLFCEKSQCQMGVLMNEGTLGHWGRSWGSKYICFDVNWDIWCSGLKLQIHIPLNTFVCLYLKTNWKFCGGRDKSCALGLQILGHSLAHMVIRLLLLQTLGQNSMNIIFKRSSEKWVAQ